MRYFLVDDDAFIRTIITDIIEEENLGVVVGEAADGSDISATMLQYLRVDVLIIDLLMPTRDGLETVESIRPEYNGKIVMLSQVETKELIGDAYHAGIDQYITKPINKLEIVNILKKINERVLLEQSIQTIQSSLNFLNKQESIKPVQPKDEQSEEQHFLQDCKYCLNELGISCEHGHKDILEMLHLIYLYKQKDSENLPTLKDLYYQLASKRYHQDNLIQKEIKSTEQRIRRAILQSLEHIAQIGLNDFSNPFFEQYAPKIFDFTQVQAKMSELKGKKSMKDSHIKINIRKFLFGIFFELQANNE